MKLSDLSKALELKEIRLKHEVVDGETLSIVCYMVANPSVWEVDNAIECRGITFNSEGECICRPFEKFFNVNENKHSQLTDLNFDEAIAYDKLDGSMITVVKINKKLYCKTKKSFYSDVALTAQKYFENQSNIQAISEYLINDGYTPIFEYQSPANQIVVEQKEEKMVLLSARNIKTGKYISITELVEVNNIFSVDIPEYNIITDIQNLISLAKVATDIEGWVIKLNSGQRVKLKTDWYNRRHRLTNYSERSIFDLIMAEEIDDLMPLFQTKENAVEKIKAIESRVSYLISNTIQETNYLVNLWQHHNLSLSEIGKKFSQHKAFPLAIMLYKNKEPDFNLYVVKNYRHLFNTTPLFFDFDTDV